MWSASTVSKYYRREYLPIILATCGLLCALMAIGFTLLTKKDILAEIQDGEVVRCGVTNLRQFGDRVPGGDLPSVAYGDGSKHFHRKADGFESQFCQAIAVTLFGDPDKVAFVNSLEADKNERFDFLNDGYIDVLFRISTCTVGRTINYDIVCGPAIYKDSQKLLFRIDKYGNDQNIPLDSFRQQKICALHGTTSFQIIEEGISGISVTPIPVTVENEKDEPDALKNAYANGDCDAVFASEARLIDILNNDDIDKSEHLLHHQEIVSNEPLVPYIRAGDERWRKVVEYSIYTTLYAAHKNITIDKNANCDTGEGVPKEWFLGTAELQEGQSYFGEDLNLEKFDKGFGCKILQQVGNYNQIYENIDELGPPNLKELFFPFLTP